MMTLEQCRQILGQDCRLSDRELEEVRDQLYALADIAITAFLDQRKCDNNHGRGEPSVAAVIKEK